MPALDIDLSAFGKILVTGFGLLFQATTLNHSVSCLVSPSWVYERFTAIEKVVTGAPEGVKRISGSAPQVAY